MAMILVRTKRIDGLYSRCIHKLFLLKIKVASYLLIINMKQIGIAFICMLECYDDNCKNNDNCKNDDNCKK